MHELNFQSEHYLGMTACKYGFGNQKSGVFSPLKVRGSFCQIFTFRFYFSDFFSNIAMWSLDVFFSRMNLRTLLKLLILMKWHLMSVGLQELLPKMLSLTKSIICEWTKFNKSWTNYFSQLFNVLKLSLFELLKMKILVFNTPSCLLCCLFFQYDLCITSFFINSMFLILFPTKSINVSMFFQLSGFSNALNVQYCDV